MSLATFKRAFKKKYQSSPAAHIRLNKVNKAKKLLISSSLQIQEVGYESGFNELSSFSHTFQKSTGLSPSEFRMSQMSKSLS
ncbi:MAG: transcriptional regulator GlxA family with amidase domain [bacterium]|jgi:transcriptional regulator GlxA family with amidase domain